MITDDAIFIKSDLNNVTKYAINSDGEFYNVRQVWIQDEFYNGMLKLGVPADVLDKTNPMGYYDLRLTDKYHYSDAQVSALAAKASTLFHKLNNSPRTERLPDIKQNSLASSQFRCNVDSLPRQPKNQG